MDNLRQRRVERSEAEPAKVQMRLMGDSRDYSGYKESSANLEEVVPKGLCWLCDPTLTYGYILLLLASEADDVNAVVGSDDWLLLLLLETQSLNNEK